MSEGKKRTKRLSLRFSIKDYRVNLKTEFEDGEALIDNISAGGCSLLEPSLELLEGEKILLVLEYDDSVSQDEVAGKVLRCSENSVAIQFHGVSEEKKQRIVKFFAHKRRIAMSRNEG